MQALSLSLSPMVVETWMKQLSLRSAIICAEDFTLLWWWSLVMMKMFSMPKLIAAVLSYEVLQLEYLDRLDSHELWVASSWMPQPEQLFNIRLLLMRFSSLRISLFGKRWWLPPLLHCSSKNVSISGKLADLPLPFCCSVSSLLVLILWLFLFMFDDAAFKHSIAIQLWMNCAVPFLAFFSLFGFLCSSFFLVFGLLLFF